MINKLKHNEQNLINQETTELCCVCLENYNNANLSDCRHSLCTECFDTLVANSKKTNKHPATCPLCRACILKKATIISGVESDYNSSSNTYPSNIIDIKTDINK